MANRDPPQRQKNLDIKTRVPSTPNADLNKIKNTEQQQANKPQKWDRQRTRKVEGPTKAANTLWDNDPLIGTAEVENTELPVVRIAVETVNFMIAHAS